MRARIRKRVTSVTRLRKKSRRVAARESPASTHHRNYISKTHTDTAVASTEHTSQILSLGRGPRGSKSVAPLISPGHRLSGARRRAGAVAPLRWAGEELVLVAGE